VLSHPRLHAVWDRVLAAYMAPEGAAHATLPLPQFWLAVIDGARPAKPPTSH
jgi:hypothetical protein